MESHDPKIAPPSAAPQSVLPPTHTRELERHEPNCEDCSNVKPVDRRRFLSTTAALGTMGLLARSSAVHAFPSSNDKHAETVIAELYASLTDSQKGEVCKDFSDKLRQRVNANWHVVKPHIGSDFYSKTQRGMAHEIIKQLTSPSGYETLSKQTEDDDGGFDAYSMAWFGKPGSESFEWMLTGRHLTLRADGNTQKKTVFGGPIVYGHGEESSPEDNLFYFQTVKVNKVFESLNQQQRSTALLQASIPDEGQVRVEKRDVYQGLSVGSLSGDQKRLVEDSLASILGVYREGDAAEANALLKEVGGLDSLYLQFYAKDDLKNDKVWDMWRIVGKNTCIHFRGAPHVHAYIHIENV